MSKAKNSYIERLASYHKLLKYRRKQKIRIRNRIPHSGFNSFVHRLSVRRLRLKSRLRFSKVCGLKYLFQKPIKVCPRCGTKKGKYLYAKFYENIRHDIEKVYGFYIQVHHIFIDKFGKRRTEVCYVRRNIGFNSGLPIDAPVLDHFYKLRETDIKYCWGYN